MASRKRFLWLISRCDCLNVAVGVWVFVLCGMPDAASLLTLVSPPTYLTIVKYFTSHERSIYRNFTCPRAASVIDEALHRGFFCYAEGGA